MGEPGSQFAGRHGPLPGEQHLQYVPPHGVGQSGEDRIDIGEIPQPSRRDIILQLSSTRRPLGK